jgi:hypothetical protein
MARSNPRSTLLALSATREDTDSPVEGNEFA